MKTDAQLQREVLDELTWEPAIDATQIGVEVKDGIVTLAGHVDSYPQKWAAERVALQVTGVKGVVLEIDIALPGSSKRKDADLARNACHALDWNTSVPKDSVKVTVQDGRITLTGEVEWAYQRWTAESAVHHLIGVVGVNNEITLKPRIQPRDVKIKIEAALQRHAHQEAKAINVSVEDGRVTLSGVVKSWAERDAARVSAWAAPGVKNVIDNLSVAA